MKKKILVGLVGLLAIGLLGNSAFAENIGNIVKGYSPNEIFNILLSGIRKCSWKTPETKLKFGKTEEEDVLMIIKEEFPIPVYKNRISHSTSFHGHYKFIQSYYDNYNFFIVYSFGNDLDEWQGKLYKIHFNINFVGKKIAEDQAEVFCKLKEYYGDYTKVESGKKIKDYIWKCPNFIVTYRAVLSGGNTYTVVGYWDKNFYASHNRHNY